MLAWHILSPFTGCRMPKPLIEEVPAAGEPSEVPTPPQARGNTLEEGAVQSHKGSGPSASIHAGSCGLASTSAAASGLKGGFLNRSAKPKKSILKKTEPHPPSAQATDIDDVLDSRLAQWSAGPSISRELAQHGDPSDNSQAAFSGFVRERDLTGQVWLEV